MRAASNDVCPALAARYVIAAGTYTEPAHKPIVETSWYMRLRNVRRRYRGEKISMNVCCKLHFSPRESRLFSHRAGSLKPLRIKITSSAGTPPTTNIHLQPNRLPTK